MIINSSSSHDKLLVDCFSLIIIEINVLQHIFFVYRIQKIFTDGCDVYKFITAMFLREGWDFGKIPLYFWGVFGSKAIATVFNRTNGPFALGDIWHYINPQLWSMCLSLSVSLNPNDPNTMRLPFLT